MNAPPPPAQFALGAPPCPGMAALRHLPGDDAADRWPLLTTMRFLADPLARGLEMTARHGPVWRANHWGLPTVVLIGPDANAFVLQDRDRLFSSGGGWELVLGRLFARGLMLLDFDEHRAHRRLLGAAFKPAPMREYARALDAGIAERIAAWPSDTPFRAYPAIKALTLDLAAQTFLGADLGALGPRINRAIMAMVAASVAVVRRPLPGTPMARGVAARRWLHALFLAEVPRRRGRDAHDMFTTLCNAVDEDGSRLSDEAVVSHIVFMMLAAHDTLTSSLTLLVHHLATHSAWQQRLADEVCAVGPGPIDAGSAETLPLTDMAFREALRLHPPVPSLPRRAMREFAWAGHRVPAGALVAVNPMLTHYLDAHWPDPLRFDPTRFTPEAVRARHKHAWIPYGGGAHMCVGLHFAVLQSRIFAHRLLTRWRVAPAAEPPRIRRYPLPKPLGGLPILLTARL